MIIRILGEGQFYVPDSYQEELNEFDSRLELALEAYEDFPGALAAMLNRVRELGEPLLDDDLVESTMVLPPSDASPEEVRSMMTEEGLVPDN